MPAPRGRIGAASLGSIQVVAAAADVLVQRQGALLLLAGFTLVPDDAMRAPLAKDYEAMAGMIFGEVPALADVLAAVSELEAALNATAADSSA